MDYTSPQVMDAASGKFPSKRRMGIAVALALAGAGGFALVATYGRTTAIGEPEGVDLVSRWNCPPHTHSTNGLVDGTCPDNSHPYRGHRSYTGCCTRGGCCFTNCQTTPTDVDWNAAWSAGGFWYAPAAFGGGKWIMCAADTPVALYTGVHDGHCASGWLQGSNTMQDSIGSCYAQCDSVAECGYFAYSETDSGAPTNCALYTACGGCTDDANFVTYHAYQMHGRQCEE